MIRPQIIVSVLVALAAWLAPVSDATGAPVAGIDIASTDVGAYPTVTVVVTAPLGEIPAGAAFTVSEGGNQVPATVDRQSTEGLEVILVLDTSESMGLGRRLPTAVAAVNDFLDLVPPEVSVGVVAYADEPYPVIAPTGDRQAVRASVATLVAAGETATYDAVAFATDQFSADADRKAVILLTDGEDTASVGTLDDAIISASELPFHIIALDAGPDDLGVLEQIARGGGGSVAPADDAALQGIYRDAVGTVANQYVVTYRSAASGPTELRVEIDTVSGPSVATTMLGLPVAATTTSTSTSTTTTTSSTTTTPPTTIPATTAAIATPAVTTPPSTAAPLVAAARGGQTGSSWPLVVGAAACFLALLLLAASLLVNDGRRKSIRSGLGLLDGHGSGPRVSHLTETMSARADRFLESSGRSRSVTGALEVAGISLRAGEFIVLVLAVTAIAALGALAFGGPLLALLIVAAAPLTARVVVGHLAAKRRAQFAEQLADNLQLLTSGLKAGHGLLASLDNVAAEAQEPSRTEFRRVLLEARVGRDLSDALSALAQRMASTDFEWVVGAIDINREIGGDLAETLDNVAETIRERQRVARQVQALTAEGRLSAYVLTGIPLFLAGALSLVNPGYLDPLFTGVGLAAVAVGVGLLVVGWFWMMRMIRLDY